MAAQPMHDSQVACCFWPILTFAILVSSLEFSCNYWALPRYSILKSFNLDSFFKVTFIFLHYFLWAVYLRYAGNNWTGTEDFSVSYKFLWKFHSHLIKHAITQDFPYLKYYYIVQPYFMASVKMTACSQFSYQFWKIVIRIQVQHTKMFSRYS